MEGEEGARRDPKGAPLPSTTPQPLRVLGSPIPTVVGSPLCTGPPRCWAPGLGVGGGRGDCATRYCSSPATQLYWSPSYWCPRCGDEELPPPPATPPQRELAPKTSVTGAILHWHPRCWCPKGGGMGGGGGGTVILGTAPPPPHTCSGPSTVLPPRHWSPRWSPPPHTPQVLVPMGTWSPKVLGAKVMAPM